ncbi:TPA: type III secretion system needle length determinant PscP [Pseudomonas aeruginosa]|uniref:type III secretion system needle length determinant PscP n=1 Tax=Pseudomonas aeruginosa TaxID=287 RepID=UPI00093B8B74|nr:type III secretion system needle length determinant PscP [Pseudomonas aeruginosa]MBI9180520.1 type III secretion system needle length determinant PscP [Pseudomonas aeruginosa]HCF7536554.1 type III secretion system needle length determinant PscP [Pseudomonas aeruginosa]HCF9361842.1 type III secretion system needle length determinant PscP [Pseudomonas aeruginosa]HCF9367952.1 type III secretion system needle length determinant PscP [Pseudomonas aeruginosa]HCF9374392.1 type III secretion system
MLKLNAVDTAPLVSSDTLAPLPPLRAQQIAFEQALPAHRPPAPRPPFDKGDETTEAAATADAPTSTPLADQPAAPAADRPPTTRQDPMPVAADATPTVSPSGSVARQAPAVTARVAASTQGREPASVSAPPVDEPPLVPVSSHPQIAGRTHERPQPGPGFPAKTAAEVASTAQASVQASPPAPTAGGEGRGEERRQPGETDPSALPPDDQAPVPLPAMQTPGDRLLARLLASSGSRPLPLADLARLLDAVQGRIQVASAAESHAARLQVRLPQLGAVEVQVLHGHGQLQVEISASPGSLAFLQQARGELLERLQRLHPEQPVQLTFNQQQDSGQRSRQRRYLHEEWQAE